jgi:transmembrane sensor
LDVFVFKAPAMRFLKKNSNCFGGKAGIYTSWVQNREMENVSNIERAIIAYLQGDSNAEETKKLLEWLDMSPANKKQFELIKNFWRDSRYSVKVKDRDDAYDRIMGEIAKSDQIHRINHGHSLKNSNFNFNWLKGMAAAILLLAIAIPIYFLNTSENPNLISEEIPALLKSQTRPGEKSRIRLSDGTIVWLNSESVLEYPKEFKGSERLVSIAGEGYFEVAHDPEKPFIVASGNTVTTALGTSFNVESYPNENAIAVSLVTGKIKVSLNDEGTYYLEPGYQFLYDKKEHSVEKKNINTDHVTAWTNGVLIFNRDGYETVVKKLQRWYGVGISSKGTPPSDFYITGQIKRNESLELTLETLKLLKLMIGKFT